MSTSPIYIFIPASCVYLHFIFSSGVYTITTRPASHISSFPALPLFSFPSQPTILRVPVLDPGFVDFVDIGLPVLSIAIPSVVHIIIT